MTTFKKENGQTNVYYCGDYVASIFKLDKKQAQANPHCPSYWHCTHYVVAYRTGRYERFEKLAEARNEALQITV